MPTLLVRAVVLTINVSYPTLMKLLRLYINKCTTTATTTPSTARGRFNRHFCFRVIALSMFLNWQKNREA